MFVTYGNSLVVWTTNRLLVNNSQSFSAFSFEKRIF